ncbi:hypothetical protein [Eubacterium xylanophilum]|uniref:hypothetical protein n=1 Tax=Eubacterium xylanophilum TaxID=39497 RepID=UPI0004B83967|nr:hypothetical protein [Eubacterium xylanophilum]
MGNDKVIQSGSSESLLVLSTLPKTWIFDLDGTLLKHNGYKIDGKDTILEGAREAIDAISEEDYILIMTSRTNEYRETTIKFLEDNNIRYNNIIFNVPMGERIVVNDRKPSGIDMAISINIDRDSLKLPHMKCEL